MRYLARTKVHFREIETICKQYQVQKMAFFGSVIREDFNEQSDIDILVNFLPEAEVDYIDFYDLQHDLSELFQRPVDLIPEAGLVQQVLREQVLDIQQVFYETKKSGQT